MELTCRGEAIYYAKALYSFNIRHHPTVTHQEHLKNRKIEENHKIEENLYIEQLISLHHKPVSAVTSKRRRSSHSGPLKMEDLPKQKDKRSISKSNKKQRI